MAEKERLGEDHPLFRTQYRLLPLTGGGGFLSRQQISQLEGEHHRQHRAGPGTIYVAGIDIAGEAEEGTAASLKAVRRRQDATVVTIGELDYSECNDIVPQPRINVVEHYWWTGRRHAELYPRMVDILKNVWRCRRIAVDATGIGEPVSSFLRKALGAKVVPVTFTQRSKSELGFNLLAVINSGRLKMYRADGSTECREFWQEMEMAKSQYRPSRTMNFYVDPAQGHDDFLMSLALLVEAARRYEPRGARGK
jgi:hypothetical protein